MAIERCCVDNAFKTKTDGLLGKDVVYRSSGGSSGGGGGGGGCGSGCKYYSRKKMKKNKNNIDDEKPRLSIWRLKDEVLTLFQEV